MDGVSEYELEIQLWYERPYNCYFQSDAGLRERLVHIRHPALLCPNYTVKASIAWIELATTIHEPNVSKDLTLPRTYISS